MILISKSLVTVVFLITVLVIALVLVVGINQKPSLENVQDIVLFLRHGERQPFIPISGLGAYKSGELTPQGQKQITQMGSHLLQAYAPFVDAVPHARVVAANEERCIRSAELVVEIFGVQYQSNIIPYMEVKPTDPNYNEFVEQEKVFAAAIPDCMKNVSTTIIQRLNVSLPEEFKLLYGILIADSLDIVRGKGLSLPYGLDDLKCTNDGPFLTSEMYDALSKLATATFGKPSFQTFLDEVKQLRQSSDPSLTIFSFSDVHISGLLSMIDGSQKIDRPGFGAHFAIHFRGDYLDIYYSPSFDQSSRLWLSSAHTDKVLENIEKAVA
ncbi:hypothetical protein BIW11_01096 [Tropilaelaps mercedesae]|uniref:Lysosomal acid phosphatase-like n=1 Tax=Tropilaelaps mercedesae TaxID=418985 RepID=A0A1V9XJZ6_9ACAR|nr:hypothetical protein BIW11_01096 [Tropilaelaps mercedesae]